MSNKDLLHLDWGFIDETYSPKFLPDLLNKAILEKKYTILQYGDPLGVMALREEVKKFLTSKLNIKNIDISNLIITNGATAAFDLICRAVLKNKYDSIVFEPVFDTALECLKVNSRKVHGIRITDEGEITKTMWSRLEKLLSRNLTKLIYTIPNFNNPTGTLMSQLDRERLLVLCRKYNVFIVEDDPYKLYNFSGIQLPENIINLDSKKENTVFITSLSKLLYPGIRIGFLVANKKLLKEIARIQKHTTSSANLLSQAIALYAFKNGTVYKAISYYQKKIAIKKKMILNKINKIGIAKHVRISPFLGGFYLWLKFNKKINTTKLVDSFSGLGITYVPGSIYYVNNDTHNFMRLSFSQIDEQDIPEAINRLNNAINKVVLGKINNNETQ